MNKKYQNHNFFIQPEMRYLDSGLDSRAPYPNYFSRRAQIFQKMHASSNSQSQETLKPSTYNHFFICSNCGYKSNELNWLCPSCNTWETISPKSAIDLLRDGGASDSKK